MTKISMLVAAIVVLGIVGVVYWVRPSPAAPTSSDNDYALPADDPQLGRRMYVHCQACHGLSGEGVPGNYPPLAGSAVLKTDQALTLVLHGAERGPVWNGQMPALAEQMADHEIAAVITWARQQWGNTGVAVTAADVAKKRR